jgi:hypothetical protein
VGHSHATTDSDIEASQFSLLINNSDEAQVVCKDIDIISRWYRNRDFELSNHQDQFETTARPSIPFEEDRIRRKAAQSP